MHPRTHDLQDGRAFGQLNRFVSGIVVQQRPKTDRVFIFVDPLNHINTINTFKNVEINLINCAFKVIQHNVLHHFIPIISYNNYRGVLI